MSFTFAKQGTATFRGRFSRFGLAVAGILGDKISDKELVTSFPRNFSVQLHRLPPQLTYYEITIFLLLLLST